MDKHKGYLTICRKAGWKNILAETRQYMERDEDGDGFIGRSFLGTVMGLTPSGKVYMPWSTNVTQQEAEEDERFFGALEKVAAEHGGWIENGEGDPCDIFFCKRWATQPRNAS